ncbi:hypothetical protein ACVWY2_006023 [Bradyrhizobium sp. JR6.1]
MRPSNTPAPVRQTSGAHQFGIAGRAQERAGHRIEHVLLLRIGHRKPVGIDWRLRLDRGFLDAAIGEHHPDRLRLLRGGGGRGVGRGCQRAVDDAALRGARAAAAGKRLQDARGAALGRGREAVVADFDGPAALADRDTGQRRLILGVEPPLRARALGAKQQEGTGAQTDEPAERGQKGNGGGHLTYLTVLLSALFRHPSGRSIRPDNARICYGTKTCSRIRPLYGCHIRC